MTFLLLPALILGAMNLTGLVYGLIYLLIVCAIIYVAWWGLSKIPLPEPVRIIVIVVICIAALLFLLQLLQGGPGLFR